jgi:purine-binding chemotaxis protein CheW
MEGMGSQDNKKKPGQGGRPDPNESLPNWDELLPWETPSPEASPQAAHTDGDESLPPWLADLVPENDVPASEPLHEITAELLDTPPTPEPLADSLELEEPDWGLVAEPLEEPPLPDLFAAELPPLPSFAAAEISEPLAPPDLPASPTEEVPPPPSISPIEAEPVLELPDWLTQAAEELPFPESLFPGQPGAIEEPEFSPPSLAPSRPSEAEDFLPEAVSPLVAPLDDTVEKQEAEDERPDSVADARETVWDVELPASKSTVPEPWDPFAEPPSKLQGPSLEELLSEDTAFRDEESEFEEWDTRSIAQPTGLVEQHVVFTLGGIEYAVPISNVLEVGHPNNITQLPHVPHWLLGLTNVRGDIISLVNLRAFLGMPPEGDERSTRMLVVRASHEQLTTGLVVDRVREICKLPIADIAPPTASIEDPIAPYLRGVTEHAGRLLVCLDLDRLLLSSELRQFEPV